MLGLGYVKIKLDKYSYSIYQFLFYHPEPGNQNN